MRTELRAAAAALLLAGCATTPFETDVADVAAASGAGPIVAPTAMAEDRRADEHVDRLLDRPLDPDTAVRIALANNRELRARLHELGIARGALIQARTVANPTVEVEVLPERNSDIELRVEYEITSLLLAPLRSRVAGAELQAAKAEVAAEVVELAYRVRTAVHAVQAARQQLAIAQRSLEAFATGRETADALLAAGNITPLEAASQIADYERARITVAELELALADRTERVHALLGLHGDALDWSIARELSPAPATPPALDALETRAVEANLDLDANRSRQTAAARRTRLAQVDGWVPDIDVDVHGLYANEPGAGDPWRFGGGVSVSVPLFDRGRGTVTARRAEHSALVQRREGLGIDLRSAARSIRNRLTSAHARARQLEQVILPAQREVTEQTVLQYHAMQVGLFAVLQAKRDELALELAYVETLREYWDATASLGALVAGRAVELGTAARLDPRDDTSTDGEH